MATIQIPMLFVGAGADRSCRRRPSRTMRGALRGGAMLTIDGARHEILQEADIYREQLLGAFDAFVPGTGERELDR